MLFPRKFARKFLMTVYPPRLSLSPACNNTDLFAKSQLTGMNLHETTRCAILQVGSPSLCWIINIWTRNKFASLNEIANPEIATRVNWPLVSASQPGIEILWTIFSLQSGVRKFRVTISCYFFVYRCILHLFYIFHFLQAGRSLALVRSVALPFKVHLTTAAVAL